MTRATECELPTLTLQEILPVPRLRLRPLSYSAGPIYFDDDNGFSPRLPCSVSGAKFPFLSLISSFPALYFSQQNDLSLSSHSFFLCPLLLTFTLALAPPYTYSHPTFIHTHSPFLPPPLPYFALPPSHLQPPSPPLNHRYYRSQSAEPTPLPLDEYPFLPNSSVVSSPGRWV